MREGTTSRVTAADRTYGKFYDFYSVSPENFGSTHVVMQYEERVRSMQHVPKLSHGHRMLRSDGGPNRSFFITYSLAIEFLNTLRTGDADLPS